MALELVSGADFLCKLLCGAGPVDLRGSRGPQGRPDPPKIDDFRSVKKSYIKNPGVLYALDLLELPEHGLGGPGALLKGPGSL